MSTAGTATTPAGPRRTPLPLRAELGRQLGRRRTQISGALLLALPLLLVAAFSLGDGGDDPGAQSFVDLAQVGAANFMVFTLFASTGFLLVVLFALYAGDAVPSEASWASLRYLLAAPVPRSRLLRVKLVTALLTSLGALVLLVGWSLVVGLVAYGPESYRSPTGERLAWAELAPRLLLIVAALFAVLVFVSALAFLIGVLTDAPLGAVGTAVLVAIISSILDSISALGTVRNGLPTHYQFAWADALAAEVDLTQIVTGTLWSVLYSVVLLTAAFVAFSRKDVLS